MAWKQKDSLLNILRDNTRYYFVDSMKETPPFRGELI